MRFLRAVCHICSPIKFVILIFCFYYCHMEFQTLSRFSPVYIDRVEMDQSLTHLLHHVGVSAKRIDSMYYAIKLASSETGFPVELITALIKTESSFKANAVSPKNYKGLMQTPRASFEYADVDVLYGSRILQSKMVAAHGSLLQALALYKGGDNPLAKRYASESYQLFIEYKKETEIYGKTNYSAIRGRDGSSGSAPSIGAENLFLGTSRVLAAGKTE